MNKCKNCKYYKAKDDKQNFGNCNCKKIQYSENLSEKDETDDMLIYWDYELYSAGFEVGKNFGCIHFKKKDNLEKEKR